MKEPPSARRWLNRPFLAAGVAILIAVVGVATLFRLFDIALFGEIGLPHEYCYVRNPKLVWLHVLSDALIGIAYVSISLTLGYIVHRASQGIPFHWVLLAFGLFIVSCGFTHFMEVWVIWQPVYWLSGFVKVVTAAASVATAVALFPLVPRIFALLEAARRSEERRVQIEQLNNELEQFNHSVAHDLRAPLRGIFGFTQMLREDHADSFPPEVNASLQRIQASAERMDALIADLLKYASVGKQSLQPVSIDPADTARSVVSLLEGELEQRRATVEFPATMPRVKADPVLLQAALQNLVSNAIKFVAKEVEPRVRIGATRIGEEVEITVSDNGVGIPPEHHTRLFKMFERLGSSQEGTGVGLSIVQRAVERMRGRIGIADSPPPGGGTTFWIRLPAG